MTGDTAHGMVSRRDDERRSFPRYELNLPINLRLGDDARWQRAILVDLSFGGFYLRTSARSSLGGNVQLTFHSRHNGAYAPQGQVVRVFGLPKVGGFAVKFVRGRGGLGALLGEAEQRPESERSAFIASELKPRVDLHTVPTAPAVSNKTPTPTRS